jgi:hypothetical protein
MLLLTARFGMRQATAGLALVARSAAFYLMRRSRKLGRYNESTCNCNVPPKL